MPYGFVYKTTYLLTKKIYIGRRKIKNQITLDRQYLGSGSELIKLIKEDKKKFPTCWHKLYKREIITFCDNFRQTRALEYYHIKKQKSYLPEIGYNILVKDIFGGGDYPTSDPRVAKKISESHIGNKYAKGRINSAKVRKESSDFLKEFFKDKENHPMFGRRHSEETKELMSNSRKGRFVGENSPLYGISKSDSQKEKQSKAMFGRKLTKETKSKISDKLLGEKNPRYGKHCSESTKKAIGSKNSGVNGGNYGKFWINNGEEEMLSKVLIINWNKGRIKNKKL